MLFLSRQCEGGPLEKAQSEFVLDLPARLAFVKAQHDFCYLMRMI